MRYEPFLFTRNQRQDFTAFVRPALLTNKDVSTIGGVFNYVNDISRLTSDFPSLYCFPLGEYVVLLRHYKSDRTHAGRPIGVIEGIAVKQNDSGLSAALPQFIDQQAELLNVTASIADIETQTPETAAEQEWNGYSADKPAAPFVEEFLERRKEDRLFLPFNAQGRDLLATVLADRRFPSPPFFAFGTNSDVLAQLEHEATIDIVSFFKTDRANFRSRVTNRVTGNISGAVKEEAEPDSAMSLRAPKHDERTLRSRPSREADTDEDAEVTHVGSNAISIRTYKRSQPEHVAALDADDEPTILTMRQMRDKIRAEESATHPPESHLPHDPLHRLLRLFSELISPHKPK